MKIKELDISVKIPISLGLHIPKVYRIKGRGANMADYSLEVVNPIPLDGYLREAPEIDKLILWDEAFYISWIPKGFVDYYQIILDDGDDKVFFKIDYGEVDLTVVSEGSFQLYNGIPYTISIVGVFREESLASPEEAAILSDKTPQDLTQETNSTELVEFSWEDLATDYAYYKVVVTNEDEGKVEQTISEIYLPSVSIYGLLEDVRYSVVVIAVSEEGIFESSPSNRVFFTPTDEPVPIYDMILDDYEDNLISGTRKTFGQIPYVRTVPISPYGMPNSRPSWTVTGDSAGITGSSPNKSIVVAASGSFKYTNFRTENPIYLASYSFGTGIWSTNRNYIYLDFLIQDTGLTNLQRPKNGYSIRFTRRIGEDKIALYKLVDGIAYIIPTNQSVLLPDYFLGLLTISSGGVITLKSRQTDDEIFSVIDITYTSGFYMGFSVGTENNVQIYGLQVY